MPLSVFFAGAVSLASVDYTKVLQEYIAKKDEHFQVVERKVITGKDYTIHAADLTSQAWKADLVTPGVWTHQLFIIKPDNVRRKKALLLLVGGSTKEDSITIDPSKLGGFGESLGKLAVETGSIVAVLKGVPTQPLHFAGEAAPRAEDAAIAYSFNEFLNTGDPTWPLLLPMVKSVVRGMDAISTYFPDAPVEQFLLTGASKRGWTTYLTAAVDSRVFAIAPMVFDQLNFKEQLKAQNRSYSGGFTDAWDDYLALDLPRRMSEDPLGESLFQIIDPYHYRGKINVPKLVMLSASDEFWTVDSSRYYFSALSQPKSLFYIPNAGHGGEGFLGKAFQNLGVFYLKMLQNDQFPTIHWKFQNDGRYEMITAGDLKEVRLWKATSESRDFRFQTIGKTWVSNKVGRRGQRLVKGKVEKTPGRYTAYFLDVMFTHYHNIFFGIDYRVSTEVKVLPPK